MGAGPRGLAVFGVRLVVGPGILVVLGAAVLLGVAEGTALARLALAAILLAALLVHELAHALAARARGVPVSHVAVGTAGGVAWIGAPAGREGRPADEWVPALAGPASNLVVAGAVAGTRVAAGLGVPTPSWPEWAFDPSLAAIGVNSLFGLGNLLPAFPADGGRVLRALLSRSVGRAAATRVVLAVGVVLALAAAVAAVVDASWPLSGALGAVSLLLFAGAVLETRTGARRARAPA